MTLMDHGDELGEFDITEDAFDATLTSSDPVEVHGPACPLRIARKARMHV